MTSLNLEPIVLACPKCNMNMEDTGNLFPPALRCNSCNEIYYLTYSGLETVESFDSRHSHG